MAHDLRHTKTEEARKAAFEALLHLLFCSMPSHEPRLPNSPTSSSPVEPWLTHVILNGIDADDALSADYQPTSGFCTNRDGRAYHLLTYLVQALHHICYLVKHVGITRQECLRVKQLILASHYPAMAMRTQRYWQSPYAILAGYAKMDGTTMLDLGALPASGRYEEWYAKLRENGEIGRMVDGVCGLIEGIDGFCSGVLKDPKL